MTAIRGKVRGPYELPNKRIKVQKAAILKCLSLADDTWISRLFSYHLRSLPEEDHIILN